MYYGPNFVNHSCRPNVNVGYMGVRQIYRASRSISKGEAITVSYIDNGNSCAKRQAELLKGYYFSCNCDLCEEEKK